MAVNLDEAETEFIKSVVEGSSSLEVFEQSWNHVLDDLTSHPLDDTLSSLAYVTAGRIQRLAAHILDFSVERAQIEASLTTDLQCLFEQLHLEDETPQPPPPSHSELGSTAHPPYIATAYKWLLDNIHNPYPSKRQRTIIARETSTSTHHIDTWFLNIRRRIGWTTISKSYFAGSKAATVAAATRALSEDGHRLAAQPGEPLPANITLAFVQMEATARDLYSDKFIKSALAGKLDALVKDMTSKDKQRKRRGKARAKVVLNPVGEEGQEGSASDVGIVAGVRVTGKRRTPDSDNDDDDPATALFEPRKRSRVLSASSSYSSISSSTSSLFSTASSRASTPSLSEPRTPSLPSYDDFFRNHHGSVTFTEPTSGHSMHIRPRLQLVSDPLPNTIHTATSYSTPSSSPSSAGPSPLFEGPPDLKINDWSSIFFDTPESAVLGELNLSSFHAPEISCAPEMAPVFYPDDITLEGLLPKDPLSCSPLSQPDLLDQVWHDEPSNPFASHYMPTTAWTSNISHPLDLQQSATDFSPCEALPMRTPSATLPILDEFSSLTSLPSEVASKLSPQHDSVKSIGWLSIFPKTLAPAAVVGDACALNIENPCSAIVTKPISITPAQRAAKLTRLHSLITQAKQIEAELVQP
ncbi:hypothetical protein ONZ45_g6530 [Pleurotus djamor]|nr:hypothetical protein ONZ45_g6530 [Pleurotus djamor]